MILRDWLLDAKQELSAAGISASALEAQILAGHVYLRDRSWILTHQDEEFNDLAGNQLLSRRLSGEPLAYILGYREFFGRKFWVNPSVLIPRQETEHLIEEALKLNERAPHTVLDIGCGSGCIAITLQLERPNWDVLATDISQDALSVTEENARQLQAGIIIRRSDLFADLEEGSRFDLIISNPPYITNQFPLPSEVRDFEPSLALFGGEDGLDFYRRLANESRDFLTERGILLLEIGFDQGDSVPQLFENFGWKVELVHDLSGHPRVVEIKRNHH